MDYYPSIPKDLFEKAIAFAKTHTTVSDDAIEIIMKCVQLFLSVIVNSGLKMDKMIFGVSMGSN